MKNTRNVMKMEFKVSHKNVGRIVGLVYFYFFMQNLFSVLLVKLFFFSRFILKSYTIGFEIIIFYISLYGYYRGDLPLNIQIPFVL